MKKEEIEKIKSKSREDIRRNLLSVSEAEYAAGNYQGHWIDMYKLYVEMTDRISQRRSSANNWFITLNTALLTAIGMFLSKDIYSFIFNT